MGTTRAGGAYALLLQDTEPSWLTMIERGATTVWEHWDGVRADGTAHDSLNHHSKGAVVSFLHRYVARIDLDDATVDVVVPAGALAQVVLPDGRTEHAGPGLWSFRAHLPAPVR